MWVVTFAVLLFAGVLLSCRARETVLSTSVLFLVAGIVIALFVPKDSVSRDVLYQLAEITLFAVLFSDGMRSSGFVSLRKHLRNTGRVLFGGMALGILIVAAVAHLVLRTGWVEAALIAAILAPTDPVFVSGIFGVREVSDDAKVILNLESGFNDGLALPAVMLLMTRLASGESALRVSLQLLLGVAVGIALPWIAIRLESSRLFGAAGVFERLQAFAIGLLVFAVARAIHANSFIAAFTGGIAVTTFNRKVFQAFEQFGEVVTELLKLAALLIFGYRVSPVILQLHHWREIVFVVVAAFLARPVAVLLATLGARMKLMDRLVIGWFGPKGFASVVYALMVLRLDSPTAVQTARTVALTVVTSIVFFSSTDVLIGRFLHRWSGDRKAKSPDQYRAA